MIPPYPGRADDREPSREANRRTTGAMGKWLWLGAFAAAVAAAVRVIVPTTSEHFLGLTESCGSVLGWWTGGDRGTDALDWSVCSGPLHSAATWVVVLGLVALVLAAVALARFVTATARGGGR